MSMLDVLLRAYRFVVYGGVTLPQEPTLVFSGAGVVVSDSSSTQQTLVVISGAGSGLSSFTGDCILSSPTTTTQVVSAIGSGGVFSVTAAQVNNQPTAGNGTITKQLSFQTAGATPGTATFAIPTNTGGRFDIIISAGNGSDFGNQTWSGKLMNQGGTITVVKAFAAVDGFDASSGATSWTTSVAVSSTNVVVTGTASSGAGTVNWTATLQYASTAT